MFTSDPADALRLAYEHVRHLREEAAARRLRRASAVRCPLAAYARRATGRPAAARLAHRPA